VLDKSCLRMKENLNSHSCSRQYEWMLPAGVS
jgi:hypothetical protein